MAGDISRSSFQPGKGNTGVRMQQGRVLLDADWNEQLDIQAYRERTLSTDLLGAAVPVNSPGFGIYPDGDSNGQLLIIGPGRMYVEGILCENEQPCIVLPPAPAPPTSPSAPTEPPNPGMSIVRPSFSFTERVDIALQAKLALDPLKLAPAATSTAASSSASATATTTLPTQPCPPSAPTLSAGNYLAYLDVWERDITALEDPSIREVALGGPDTTTRTRVVWQVKLQPMDQSAGITCPSNIYQQSFVNYGVRTMSAQAAATDPSSNPCVIPATAGYRSLENQMYRVEIHNPGKAGTATFKWSRDNASVVVGWQSGDGDLSVTSLGRDDVLGFAGGQWVELTDDSHEYAAQPGTLVQLSNAELVGQVPTLTIDTTTALPGAPLTFASFPSNPKVRRWDQSSNLQSGAVPLIEGTPIDLENGVQVSFAGGGTYQTGDYWLIPARTATTASQPTVIWPVDALGNPQAQAPQGIVHHLAALAVLNFNGQAWSSLSDCRRFFSPITANPSTMPTAVHTLSSNYTPVFPGTVLPPSELLSGIQIFFDQGINENAINVSTFSVSVDLPVTDESFAETSTPNQQVPVAMTVKALGTYNASSFSAAVWHPFNSTRNYLLTRLAAFGALTLGQGLAQVRLQVQTAAILFFFNAPSYMDESTIFTLSAWVQPYTDPSTVPAPAMRVAQIYGPDASGDYLAVGYMEGPVFAAVLQLPALDVSGNKLYSNPVEMGLGLNVYAYVPSALERQGNFSHFSIPILDPNTGGAYPGNVIPASELPAIGKDIGIFAWRYRSLVPPPSPYSAYYGYYAGGAAIGGELI